MTNTTMKAVRVHAYGAPDTMKYEDAPVPTPGAGQVLVRVADVGVNPIEAKIISGAMKEMMPVTFPYTPGSDLAGTVESLGAGVSDLAPGQAVYGLGEGTYAQFALAPTSTLCAQPKSLSPQEAASVPMAAMTAWVGLFDHGELEAGQTILIHGAAGGVGMFAVQFAKWKGANVIATASGAGVAFVQKLGADQVIDYKATRFEDEVRNVDVVLDLIGGDTQARSFGVLKPGGILVATSQPPSPDEAKAHGVRAMMFNLRDTASSDLLKQIGDLLDAGEVKTVVSHAVPLNNAAQQSAHSEHALGKTVLRVAA